MSDPKGKKKKSEKDTEHTDERGGRKLVAKQRRGELG